MQNIRFKCKLDKACVMVPTEINIYSTYTDPSYARDFVDVEQKII